jgi:hypothetical protein
LLASEVGEDLGEVAGVVGQGSQFGAAFEHGLETGPFVLIR